MKSLIVALALAGCAHVQEAKPAAPLCRTACGLVGPGDCTELQEAENATRWALAKYADSDSENTCQAMRGWRVELHKSPEATCITGWRAIVHGVSECIVGLADDSTKIITLTDSHCMKNAFAHEVAHVVDFEHPTHEGHCAWAERGIKRALLEVTGEEDRSDPEKTCPATASTPKAPR